MRPMIIEGKIPSTSAPPLLRGVVACVSVTGAPGSHGLTCTPGASIASSNWGASSNAAHRYCPAVPSILLKYG